MIREGRKSDLEAAKAIAKECGFHGWAGASLTGWAQRPSSIFLVAEEKGKVVGFLLCRCIFDEAELLVIGVTEEFRHYGYGTELVDLLTRRLMISGIDKVFLEVDTQNLPAINLYENQGYKIIGRRKNYYEGKRDAYVMELKL